MKGCKRKHLTTEEYIQDLKIQRDALTHRVAVLRKGTQAAVDQLTKSGVYKVERPLISFPPGL